MSITVPPRQRLPGQAIPGGCDAAARVNNRGWPRPGNFEKSRKIWGILASEGLLTWALEGTHSHVHVFTGGTDVKKRLT